jgi:hypothetical protein
MDAETCVPRPFLDETNVCHCSPWFTPHTSVASLSFGPFGGMSAPVSVQFTPLYGTGKHEPLCSVLKIDDVTILLDCGWNDTFDEAIVAPLRGLVPCHPSLFCLCQSLTAWSIAITGLQRK